MSEYIAIYVTPEEYKEMGGKISEANADLPYFLEFASMQVNAMAFGRIDNHFDKLKPRQQELVKKAVVLQADFLEENGVEMDSNGILSSFTVDGLTMSYDGSLSTSENQRLKDNGFNKKAYFYLKQSGLDWRGV